SPPPGPQRSALLEKKELPAFQYLPSASSSTRLSYYPFSCLRFGFCTSYCYCSQLSSASPTKNYRAGIGTWSACCRNKSACCLPADLVLWQQQMPRLWDDSEKVVQTICSIFRIYDPTWADVQQLFEAVFTLDKKIKIWETNYRWAREASGRAPWPANDSAWDPSLPANRDMLQRVRGGLLESLELSGRKTVNWDKVRECQQGNTENPEYSEYYA
uniref:Core shell protein Gag P30 domain-containing protein n=1 Tax=Calidris pygmaea TaxID=425635 RepID=A0A8C3KBW0_9CHAR